MEDFKTGMLIARSNALPEKANALANDIVAICRSKGVTLRDAELAMYAVLQKISDREQELYGTSLFTFADP